MTGAQAVIDYSEVTELSGARGSRAQLLRMCQRYYFAATFCAGKDVLEVACGAGQGLGYLARTANRAVGVDIDDRLVALAQADHGHRVDILKGNAAALDFPARSFDVVVFFEALYYLPNPERFAAEAMRVLRPGGVLILCTANKDLPDFNPSPYSYRYFGPPDLLGLLSPLGFSIECYGGDPVGPPKLRTKALRQVKRVAVRLHLIPKTMRGKEFLKRMVFGELVEFPTVVPDGVAVEAPRPIPTNRPDLEHRVLYAVAWRPGQS